MVWTPQQCGEFLDSIEALRLYGVFHVAAYYGLRRGEVLGVAWSDIDLATRRLHVRGDVKSEDSDREIVFDEQTAAVPRAWRQVQRAERLAWGRRGPTPACASPARTVRPSGPAGYPSGSPPWRPGPGCPPVRFHDLRHGSASMLLAAGNSIKVVSEIMGHATSAFTADVYVTGELAEAAAASIAAFVPRNGRASNQ